MTVAVGMTVPKAFTCAGCMLAFDSFDKQREHYHSELHHYNLNRKVKGLPPITESHFAQLVAKAAAEAGGAGSPATAAQFQCDACRKSFSSEGAYQNHRQSRKHLEAEAVFQPRPAVSPEALAHRVEDSLALDGTESEERAMEIMEERRNRNALNLEHDCIFCSQHKSQTFEENVAHMTGDHSLYLPDLECLVDLRGLFEYLADKVTVGYCCLYCEERKAPFHSLDAVRKHMIDKGHVKIRFDEDGAAELGDYYDWDAMFEDLEDENAAEGSSGALILHSQEGYSEDALITPDGTELVLPGSNRRLGNRAYVRYYRQNLRPYDAARERRLLADLKDEYIERGLAIRGTYFTPTEKRDRRSEQTNRAHQELALGVKANKFQPFLRLQIR